MNTANLQMEGLLLALGSLMRALEEKGGWLSEAEIQEMLARSRGACCATGRSPLRRTSTRSCFRFASSSATLRLRSRQAVFRNLPQRSPRSVTAEAVLAEHPRAFEGTRMVYPRGWGATQ